MGNELRRKYLVDGLFWLVTAVVVCLVLLPIYSKGISFPFIGFNILFIGVALTWTRYIFFLKNLPFSHFTPLKLIFIFTAIPLMIILLDGFTAFQAYHDEVGLQELVPHLSLGDQRTMIKYIKTEYTFFAVSSIICAIILPVRMIVSMWRVRHKGTV